MRRLAWRRRTGFEHFIQFRPDIYVRIGKKILGGGVGSVRDILGPNHTGFIDENQIGPKGGLVICSKSITDFRLE